ncbi:class I SAM-dependent methyltransferase [Alkalihalobacillus sp. LMS39]|uniref:class I SAM-dependent methyltransferase n=1 Tax=Alkalihalobacillus sp. LMS39 TaxID=2924032 RepID=UPI001FB1BF11|nr:class I SAM-dependent methyltransferase [Alkalihalobacillus sp. LMS39]UOE95767.1 class I SAM-dependent methyltransferase [Alkalihalobacillus sp. LMS39]
MSITLDRVVFIGRTFEEYLSIFQLTEKELQQKRVLDCPAGACSFTAVANKKGMDVTACDIAYVHQAKALLEKGKLDIEHAMEQVQKEKDLYVWDYFNDVTELAETRKQALADCYEHMVSTPDRYHAVTLPSLPFQDHEFDIILSAHFLFLYADRLDFAFHKAALTEMLRVVSEEVRIFPLVDLNGNRYEHLDEIIEDLRSQGYSVEERLSDYEFQQNANSMLVIKKR